MAYKIIGTRWAGVAEIVADAEADVSSLPACATGSKATVVGVGEYIVNASGEWKLHKKINAGGGGEGGGSETMIVNVTMGGSIGDAYSATTDKTTSEIREALDAGQTVVAKETNTGGIYHLHRWDDTYLEFIHTDIARVSGSVIAGASVLKFYQNEEPVINVYMIT